MTTPKRDPWHEVRVLPATCYRFDGYQEGYGRYWASITIREWPQGGGIDVQSDMGSYAYEWRSIGSMPLREFLCGLQMDYFMEKTRGRAWQEFSPDDSKKSILRDVLRARREGSLLQSDVQYLWGMVKDADVFLTRNEDAFLHQLFDTHKLVEKVYCGMYENIPFEKRPKAECVQFWQVIWPKACAFWRQELKQEAGAAR